MKQKIPEKSDLKNILILNLGGLGDLLLSVPALRALRQYYAKSQIYLLAVPGTADLIKNLRYVDNVFPFSFYPQRYGLSNLIGLIQTLLSLRKEKIDLMINMRTIASWQSAIKIALIFWLINARYKLGRDTVGRGFFLNLKIPETDIGIKHESEYDIDTISLFGIDVSERKFEINIDSTDKEFTDNFIKNLGIGPEDLLVGIHPGGMLSRRWPIENFAEVINELREISDKIRFVVTGGGEEIILAEKLQKLVSDKLIIVTGRTTIGKTVALINKCNIFISNDTGVMHIAAVLQKPQIAIFGPGDIERYNPAKISPNAIVLRPQVDCPMPCNKYDCDSLKCLKQVTPKEVIIASKKILVVGN